MRYVWAGFVDHLGNWVFLWRDQMEKRRIAAAESRARVRAQLAGLSAAQVTGAVNPARLRSALNGRIGGLAVWCCLVLAGTLAARSMSYSFASPETGPSIPPGGNGYFLDLSTQSLFAADADQFPPIIGPSAAMGTDGVPTAVRAYVFTCGSCDDASQRFVGYLETLTPEAYLYATRAVIAGEGDTDETFDRVVSGYRVASPDLKTGWVIRQSPEAGAVFSAIETKCGRDRQPQPCRPDAR